MLSHFTTSPRGNGDCAIGLVRSGGVVAPRGFEPRLTDSKSAVLPLDEGAAGQRNGAEDGIRTRDPHLGKVMLYQLSHFRSGAAHAGDVGAESQSRTGDTAIFSRVLYQLSYLGPARPPGRSNPTASRRIARAPAGLNRARPSRPACPGTQRSARSPRAAPRSLPCRGRPGGRSGAWWWCARHGGDSPRRRAHRGPGRG